MGKQQNKRNVKKPVQSIQMNLPIREIADGIVVTKDNRYVQIFEVTPINFMMKSEIAQNAVIDDFISFLKIAPNSMQIKCITCASDMSLQITRMAEDMITEQNQNCYEMQQEQIERFKLMQDNSVSRRFFISFANEEYGLFKQNDFYEIRDKLKRSRIQLASYLEACGNKVIINQDETEQVGEILYTLLNREYSKTTQFYMRVKEVYDRYISSGKIKDGTVPYIPPTDFISPNKIDFQNSDFVNIDGKYYCYCYIPSDGYPVNVLDGWMNTFINLGEGIDLDIFINRMERSRMAAQIRRSLKTNTVAAMESGDNQDSSFHLDKALQSGNYLLSGINNGQDFYYLNTLITVSGDSPEIVELRVKELQKLAVSRNMKVKICKFEQEEAFLSSLPLCKLSDSLYRKGKRNILTNDIASVYPFISYEMNDENGILWGIMQNNASPVIIDQFDHTKYVNGNLFITGVTGAGKSSLLKSLALRMRMRKTPSFIIVPEKQDEFRRLCDAVGGQFIEIGAGSPTRINILEIFKRDETVVELIDEYKIQSSLLVAKVQDLKTFFQLLIPDLTYEERQLMDTALMRTYEKKGITTDNLSLLDKANPSQFKKDMPILADLYETLLEMKLLRLANIIKVLVTGSGSSFNGHTNVDLDNDFMVFGLEKTNDELLPAGMFLAVDFIYSKIKEDKSKQKVLFIEEVWKLMLNPHAAGRILEISKLIRAYGGSLVLATQQLKDITALDGGIYGEGIVNSCAFKIVLKHNEADEDMLINIMKLAPQEATLTPSFSRGSGLIVAGGNSVAVDFTLSPKEYDLITTDPRDLAKRKAEKLKGKKCIQNLLSSEDETFIKISDFSSFNYAEMEIGKAREKIELIEFNVLEKDSGNVYEELDVINFDIPPRVYKDSKDEVENE